MRCPFCSHEKSRVVDSRDVDEGIRRRRRCLACNARFTTYERHQRRSLLVVKKDGRREEFNREKLSTGIRKACEKRPLPTGAIDKLVDDLESEAYRAGKTEIFSSSMGDMVADRLRELDHIAYIRFASVYREFGDLPSLKDAVDTLVKDQASGSKTLPGQLPLPLTEGQPVNTRRRRTRGRIATHSGKGNQYVWQKT